MALQATLFYSGILGCLYIYLSAVVTKLRLTHDVHLDDGGHRDLLRAIRIHANFSEYVPFTLFLLLLCELIGGRPWMIHTLSLTFIAARILHMIGLRKLEGPSIYRFLGATLTWCVISILSIFCLISAF